MKTVIIGGGPAGRIASMELGSLGEDVTLIEKNHLAGTCLNEGCMVICGLNEIARFLNNSKKFENLGLLKNNIEFSYKDVKNGVKKTQELIRKINHKETVNAGVNVVYGEASSIDENKVYVGDEEYQYDKLIIATGSRPHKPKIKGIEHALTHKNLLDLEKVPEKTILIGSGIISAEIANIFSSMGSETYILCRTEFLKGLNKTARDYVEEKLLKDVNIYKNVEVKEILENEIIFQDKNSKKISIKGTIFNASGRVANSEIVKDIVKISPKGEIEVNEQMQTSVKNIYSAGDVVGGILSTPVSRMEGTIAARNCAGISSSVNYENIANTISLDYDVSYLNIKNSYENEEDYQKITYPGVGGYGSFWSVLTNETGVSEILFNKKKKIIESILSIGPNTRLNMAYMSFLMRVGVNVLDMEEFVEIHPSTDTISLMVKY